MHQGLKTGPLCPEQDESEEISFAMPSKQRTIYFPLPEGFISGNACIITGYAGKTIILGTSQRTFK
jgi:hypothetical protein